ncbi:sialic acid-binding Ig-like lectin 13 [Salvelinus namaycush]|uniref:Sialic acid-binding Ig-like lectin 13 n=1 Tax=Salvelinus namaycush TaxID=8040 RepID=A0A8U0Q8U4_SALNM|nr:sialic acid-binding Ig-like lectin 13 [Salvelinus namaycush]
MPDRLDVLTGSCIQIPCTCNILDKNKYTFNSTIPTFGVWIKESPDFGLHPDNVIFNSSETVNRYQGKITGNMSQKNCTTVFFNVTTSYTNKYFFRIESQPFRATDTEKSVDIVVWDLPSSPIITVSGEMKEGTPVSLNCSAIAPCPEHPPELTWTLPTQFTTENQLQENPDQTKSVLSTVTFTPSYLHHEKNITCTAVYPVGASNKTAEHNMMLNVSFSPKDTSASISPADPESVGSCVNLTCSSTANPPVTNFTWFQISGDKPIQVATGLHYSLNVTAVDGGLYFCEARNSHGCGKSNDVQLASKGPEEHNNSMVFWVAAGTLAAFLFISLISLFNFPVGTVCANQATAGEEPEERAEDQSEEIHYGDIDFSKLQTKETPAAAQDRVQGQESEYAEVNVTRRGAQEPPLNNLDGLYAQEGASDLQVLGSKEDMGSLYEGQTKTLFDLPKVFWEKETQELRVYFTQQMGADLPQQVEGKLKALEDRVFWEKETQELRVYFTQQVGADLPHQVEGELKALEDRISD